MATITHLDPIRTSDHVIATNLCLKLAFPLFYAAMTAQAKGEQDETLDAWRMLRLTAEKLAAKQAVRLDENELAALGRAVQIAHDTAHSVLPMPAKSAECRCSISETAQTLFEMFTESERRAAGIPGGANACV